MPGWSDGNTIEVGSDGFMILRNSYSNWLSQFIVLTVKGVLLSLGR